MPKLLVKLDEKAVVFPLKLGETVIGRDDDCALRLPHVSVSRHHCRVMVGRQNTTVEDLDSQNGIMINGKLQKQHVLKSGDELQIGVISLVYLSDSPKDRFYKGRYVEYMSAYNPELVDTSAEGAATRVLGVNSMLILQQGNHLIDNARVISLSNTENFWYPMDRRITFGNGGMVQVGGWFTWGTVAEVAWDGSRHILRKLAWWVPVKVKNQSVQRQALNHGAHFQIGDSRFRYDAPPLLRG